MDRCRDVYDQQFLVFLDCFCQCFAGTVGDGYTAFGDVVIDTFRQGVG
ncbi:hypothetical protein [Pseudovibrio denitrificans]|nr:hypothetical protein [Pseudovibrio denitrificans]